MELSVSLSRDGNPLATGAVGNDGNGILSGYKHIFNCFSNKIAHQSYQHYIIMVLIAMCIFDREHLLLSC